MGLTKQLVKFSGAEVPEAAAAMMRLSLFDWAACGVAGARQPDFIPFRRAQMVEEGPAHVFGGDAAGAATAPAWTTGVGPRAKKREKWWKR